MKVSEGIGWIGGGGIWSRFRRWLRRLFIEVGSDEKKRS